MDWRAGVRRHDKFVKPAGDTQAAFAARVSWTRARVNEFIRGKRGVTADAAPDLAAVLRTSSKVCSTCSIRLVRTWYTGSAAWMWRLGVERILGLHPENGGVRIEPCLPRSWRRADVTIRQPGGTLAITIENPDGVETGIAERWVDGVVEDQAVVVFPAFRRS